MALRLFTNPEPIVLEEVGRTYRVQKRLKKVREVLDGSVQLDPAEVFRSHEDRDDDVIEEPDITYRAALDLLLGGLSALHIGGMNSRDGACLDDDARSEICNVLGHDAVSRYFKRNYPYAPPLIVRDSLHRRLPTEYAEQWRMELSRAEFEYHYRSFLTLDARFVANEAIGDFLELLDDFYVRGDHISDLHWALEKPERLKSWLKARRRLRHIEGMQSFFNFAEDLDYYLAQLTDWPVLRGNVWLHFAYWFGTGGDRMYEVACWLEEAVAKINENTINESATELRSCLRRLRDASLYPGEVIAMLPKTVRVWMVHADVRATRTP